MSDHRPGDVLTFIEPAADVRVGRDAYVYLWDAHALGHDWLDATVPEPVMTQDYPAEVVIVHVEPLATLAALDLSTITPDQGSSLHGSLYEMYDRWQENWIRVRATRVDDAIEIEVGYSYDTASPDAPWDVAPRELYAHVRCDADALCAALAHAESRAREVDALLATIQEAGPGAPWQAWAEHPDHAVRERVSTHRHADHDVLTALARRGEHAWKLLARDDLPARAIESLVDVELPAAMRNRIANHPNTSVELLEEIARRGENVGKYNALSKPSTIARARLSELAIANCDNLDAAFGELRGQLDANPSEHAWDALLKTLEAGLTRDPGRVAEVWVPYARGRMDRWRAFDCSVPRADVNAWAGGAPPRPIWGVCKRLMLDSGHTIAADASWAHLRDSPFTAGLRIFAHCQPPTKASLDAIASLALPELEELILSNWGEELPTTLSYDLERFARAAWSRRLRELTLSHLSPAPGSLVKLLESTPALTWLSLRHINLTQEHGEALARSGALEAMRHLNLDEAATADILGALAARDLPAVYHLSVSNSDFTNAHMRLLCQSTWAHALTELYLTHNPGLTDITPLLEIAGQMQPHAMIRLEGCAIPTPQAAQLESILPKATIRV